MKRVTKGIGSMVAVLALGCAGGDEGGGVPGDVASGGIAGAGGGVGTTPGGACTVGEVVPCTCIDGTYGTQRCQADGTLSLCGMCEASGAGAAPVGGAPSGDPTATPTTGDPSAQVVPDANGVVLVPPEDVATCNGAGVAPGPEEEVEVLEIRTDQAVPGGFQAAGGTVYACFWVEIDMPEKHHIVGWEGALGGDRTVHHQQVSLSPRPAYLDIFGQGGLCGLPTVEYTWTGGTTPEWTPSLAGFPIGGPENGGKAKFLWQTHFEGATTYTGGFNAYVTKKLRKYDAGNFEQGDVSGILVPAGQAASHVATCTPEMTTQKLVHPIYVYSSMLHAHLTITHIKGEHFRGGQLMNTLGEETALGFGFFDQTFKPHTPCIEILPGDQLVTSCDYQNPFPYDVVGGEATNQEMCTTFMQYFPRLPGTSNSFCGTIDSSGGFMP